MKFIRDRSKRLVVLGFVVMIVFGGLITFAVTDSNARVDPGINFKLEIFRFTRIALITIFSVFLWQPSIRFICRYLPIDPIQMYPHQIRFICWYLAFEAVLLLSII